jgi:DNA-directed RNA polymerase specialized sigma24 family protein
MATRPDLDTARVLINAVIADDPAAVEHFVRRYTRLGHHDADDVIQRVFVKLLEDDCHRLRTWQGEVFEPFLRQVVHNKARRSPAHSFVRTTTRALGPRSARQ